MLPNWDAAPKITNAANANQKPALLFHGCHWQSSKTSLVQFAELAM
ncbi:hypothetical protein KPL74_19815 [Bacillus sp. NP157]|nr:hypothetical protein KPL74_19815 [Bacillus sp. NP157]